MAQYRDIIVDNNRNLVIAFVVMRFILAVAAIMAVLHAKSFKMNVRSTGSLRAKLIASGQYPQYLDQQRKYRIQKFRKGSLPIADYADEFYVGEVSVGTPGSKHDQ
ncbi:hypothetical protein ANCDUO_13959 [Ancylostoma duodenale]|uniref:Uncharacterized protein n=1 Tax=Ancylostoma duodenale TaxID=51022 RepID=A0A0C2CHP4_9BILA|nr:hypothetical protein ANCDUO_13959 [Ancylostoma duodenale]